jgi:Domain of unknown function (DUF4124)
MRMAERCLPAMLLILAAVALPALADTYKWVDEKGVVNYSNAPPPGKAPRAQIVEERISIVTSDPSLLPAIAAMRARADQRAQYEEIDWQQRQRFLLAAQTSYPQAYGTGNDSYGYSAYPYYVPAFAVRPARRFPPFVAQPSPFPSGDRNMMRTGQGFLRY